MYLAMNRFRIKRGFETEFETLWRERESRLDHLEGFLSFDLLRGATDEQSTLYASHTVWASQDAFDAWTRSSAFRDAHRGAGDHGDMFLDHPDFEGFDQVEGTSMRVNPVSLEAETLHAKLGSASY